MRNEKNIKWLYKQLPDLLDANVIDDATASRIRNHFGEVDDTPDYSLGFIIASSLGAILIGGGIIMLFAYNWENFSLTLRTIFSFLPLIVAQIIYGYVYFKKPDKTAWVEASSGFLMLMLAATISLISQTYHIEGSTAGFLMSWMLLSIPLLYLMNATLPALFYLVGIASWAANVNGETSVYYWAFLAAAIPHLYLNINPKVPTTRGNLLGWTTVLTLGVAWFNVIEVDVPEFLLVATAIMLSMIYFVGLRLFPKGGLLTHRPFRSFAIGGVFIMTMILGYDWPRSGGGENWMLADNYDSWAVWVNIAITLLGLLALGYFAYEAYRRGELKNYWVLTFPIMIFVGLLLAQSDRELISIVLANFFMLGFGIYYIREGIQTRMLSLINLGMLFLTAMIVARFFDADLSLMFKGIVFILLGIGFLSVNVIMSRRLKQNG